MSPRNGEPDEEGDSRGGRSRGQHKAGGSRGGSGGEDYRRRRDRNNLAVKRSRVRTKLRTQETLERVRTLKTENHVLEDQIQALDREVGFLKDLLIKHSGSTTIESINDLDLEAILKENTDDDLLRPAAKREGGGRSSIDHRRDFKAESPGDGDGEDSQPPGPS